MYEAPAVQFYFGDFLNDTAHMTLEERGAYMTLLSYAWINEGLPLEEKKIRTLLGISPHKYSKVWPEIKSKFFALPDRYVNPRMEEERGKQAAYRAKQAAAGRKGGQAKASSNPTPVASDSLVAKPKPEPSSSSTTSSSTYGDQTTNEHSLISANALQPLETQSPDEIERDDALKRLADDLSGDQHTKAA